MKEKLAKEKAEKLKKSILDNQMKIYKIQKDQEMRTKERHMRMLAQTEQRKYSTIPVGPPFEL